MNVSTDDFREKPVSVMLIFITQFCHSAASIFFCQNSQLPIQCGELQLNFNWNDTINIIRKKYAKIFYDLVDCEKKMGRPPSTWINVDSVVAQLENEGLNDLAEGETHRLEVVVFRSKRLACYLTKSAFYLKRQGPIDVDRPLLKGSYWVSMEICVYENMVTRFLQPLW